MYAKPDKVILSFGISTSDTDLLAAKRKSAEIWKEAAAALKENGVPDRDVQTDYLSIDPRYRDYTQLGPPASYVAVQMFVVTLSDPARVEPLVSKMLEMGVNRVYGVEFQTTQFKHYRESGAGACAAAAREKAEKMAAVLGCTAGKPLAINENLFPGGGSSWYYYSSWSGGGYFGYGRPSGMSQNVVQDMRGPAGGDPGSMALGKKPDPRGVSVVFEIEGSCRRCGQALARALPPRGRRPRITVSASAARRSRREPVWARASQSASGAENDHQRRRLGIHADASGLPQEGEESRGDQKRSDHEGDLVDSADQQDQESRDRQPDPDPVYAGDDVVNGQQPADPESDNEDRRGQGLRCRSCFPLLFAPIVAPDQRAVNGGRYGTSRM